MPAPRTPAAPLFKTMLEATENARDIARQEIAELKKDLATLDRILAGRKKAEDFALIDIAHSAFEIFRTASMVLENEQLMADMGQAVDDSLAEGFLAEHGAALLKEPEGWHWISPKGVMRHLGPGEDPVGAAAKLKRYLPKTPAKGAEGPAGDED
ncbi:hypothetical protein [Desulfocurvus sp. DL9XJH121]